MQKICPNLLKYLATPYLRGGNSFEGTDCWGLIRLYYRHELGIELPTFTDFAQSDTPLFKSVNGEAMQSGDVILIAHNKEIDHCGVVLTDCEFLHTLENSGAQVSKICRWQQKIVSCHRYCK